MEQFPTLVLLVGENNLPNILAVLTFLDNGGAIYFVHSKETSKHADILPQIIEDLRPGIVGQYQFIEIDLNHLENSSSILSKGLGQVTGKVCFSYTGGTKSMVVYTLLELQRPTIDMTLIYLYAGTNTFIIDYDQEVRRYRPSIYFDLRTLLKLHFLSECPYSSSTELFLPHTAQKILRLHLREKSSYFNFKQRYLRDLKKGKCDPASFKLPLDRTKVGSELKDHLIRDLGVRTLGDALPFSQISSIKDRDFEFISRWFDGSWLEEVVFIILQKNKKDLNIKELGYNLTVNPPNKVRFELDVFCIVDSMFFGISCTSNTGHRKLNKDKLFEVAKRTSQIAGAEARFALITLFSDPMSIREELSAGHSIFRKKFLVLGMKDIPHMEESLVSWIGQNVASREVS